MDEGTKPGDDPDDGDAAPRRRLYVGGPLAGGVEIVPSSNQAHWLTNVVRMQAGDEVAVFDGASGEWRARLGGSRKRPVLVVGDLIRPQEAAPDLWLLFAPIKGARVEMIAEKATELGVGRLMPVVTRRTAHPRVNVGRIRANAIEAAEQCGGLLVPDVDEPRPLADVLGTWDPSRRLLFCDEDGGRPALLELGRKGPGPWAILIGPEGGFDPAERAQLKRLPFAVRVSLGRRILRAETAATAALTLWHAVLGAT